MPEICALTAASSGLAVATVALKKVADWMIKHGYKAPIPKTPAQLLAIDLASAAREETRYDRETGRPYRGNHAFWTPQGNPWFDIDEKPPRRKMHMSLMRRCEQMVGDGLQLSLDADHWNSANATQAAIQIPLDFEMDVAIRKLAPEEDVA